MTRLSSRLAAAGLLFAAVAAPADPLPMPPELKPDVDFWISVFTGYDTDEGVLHDSRHLDVVYDRVAVPASLGRRDQQRRISARRDQLEAVLTTLASGKRTGLSDEEARVLTLWPDDVSNETLRAAAGSIRFQRGLADRFRQGIERSGRWRTFIEAELGAQNVPIELAALPHVESSYDPGAQSHVGASGIWQFTRSTGRRFMRVDHVLDERNDPFAATRGAARLLAYNYSITGNWPMAITAYNHGLAGVRRAMRQHGDTAYADIFRNYRGRTFGFASRNFYVAFLAAVEVDRNADSYFPGVVREPPVDYDEVELDAYIPAEQLAASLGVTRTELARHNPALQPAIFEGSKHVPKGFRLRLPPGRLSDPLPELLAAIPEGSRADEQLPDMYHRVARGDTLSQIAADYDTRVSTLVALNNLGSRHRIRAGQRLRLPAAGTAPAEAPPREEPVIVTVAAETSAAEPEEPAAASDEAVEAEVVAGEAAVGEMTPAAMAQAEATEAAEPVTTALLSDPSDYSVADDGTIEVQPLETLGHYGDWLGIRTQRLRDANGFAFRTPVAVGQRIELVFEDIDAATFEARRIEYHRNQQDRFFREHVITGVTEHEIRPGESIWVLSLRVYGVPLWLFRQYNPELELDRIRPGITVRFPELADAERS